MTSSLLFNITTFAYLISMLCFFVHLASRNELRVETYPPAALQTHNDTGENVP